MFPLRSILRDISRVSSSVPFEVYIIHFFFCPFCWIHLVFHILLSVLSVSCCSVIGSRRLVATIQHPPAICTEGTQEEEEEEEEEWGTQKMSFATRDRLLTSNPIVSDPRPRREGELMRKEEEEKKKKKKKKKKKNKFGQLIDASF